MRVYEYYTGTRWGFEAKGEFSFDEFTKEIKKLFPIQTAGKNFGDVVHRYKKFGEVVIGDDDNKRVVNTMVKSDRSDPEANVYSWVVML